MKRNRKLAGLMALLLAAVAVLSACGGGASQPAASGSSAGAEPLRVGMECAYAPFNWTQLDDSNGAVPLPDGTYAGGYDVEIAKRVAQSLGRELVIVKTEWDGLPPSLTSGKIDAVVAGMTNTAERRETMAFSDDYYVSDLVIVVQKDGTYAGATSLADFSGAKITGQLATLHYDVIDQIPDVDKQQAMKDFPTMVAALSSGKIDGYISERPGALSATASNPNLTFIGFEGEEGFDYSGTDIGIAIGLRKDDAELRDAINAALAEISQEERDGFMADAVKNQPLNAGEE